MMQEESKCCGFAKYEGFIAMWQIALRDVCKEKMAFDLNFAHKGEKTFQQNKSVSKLSISYCLKYT